MTKKTTEQKSKKNNFSLPTGQGTLFFARNVSPTQIFVFAIGIFITLILFLIFSVIANNISQQEYKYLSEHTAQNFFTGAKNLDSALQSGSNLISLSQDGNYDKAIKNMVANVPEVDRFNLLILMLKNSKTDRWVFKTIFLEGAAIRQYENDVIVDKTLIRHVAKYRDDNNFNDYSSYLVPIPKGSRLPNTHPILLAKNIEGERFKDRAILLGITDIGLVFPDYWLRNQATSGRILMTHSSGAELQRWSMASDDVEGEVNPLFSNAFVFSVWQDSMELFIEVVNSSRFIYLMRLPIVVLILGFIITALAVLYVRDSQMKSQRFQRMNKRLERKNVQMRSEAIEREKLNKALRQSEKENRSIIDAVSDIIFETNTRGELLFLSASWRKVTGFDVDQFVGQELFSMLHPQDQKNQMEDFKLLVKGQKQAYRSFTRLRTSDGTFRAVEIAFSMIRQDKNRNLRVVGSFTDVEERRRAERALSEAEKKYRAIVENAAGGIYQMTPEGIYLSANPAMARILGFETPEQILREVKNANITLYVDPKARMNLVRELHSKKEMTNNETQMLTKEGNKIWVNENIRVVRDDAGNVLYFEGSIADVTQRKESEIALREAKINSDLANRAKSEFLANMSHELRTPLNSIIGFSEIIKDEVFGKLEPSSYWEYAKDINESGQSLLKVINEILDISKIEAGERQLNETVVDLRDVVHSCLDLLSGKIENNQMQIIKALDNVPKVIGEELAVKQIFMNLISNAVKFTPSGGRLTVSFEVGARGELSISFTDTGIGLDDAEIQKALSPFGQADSEDLARDNSGTGLGLTLVDALIKMHDGRFELFSEKGIGTTATVVFPVERITVQSRSANEEKGAKAQTDLSDYTDL